VTSDTGIVGRGSIVAAGIRPIADPRLVPAGNLGPDIRRGLGAFLDEDVTPAPHLSWPHRDP